MKKKILVVGAFISLIIILGIIFFKCNLDSLFGDTIFFDILTTFTAIFGVFAIIFQTGRSKDLDEAQFIINLNQQYFSNENYQKVVDLLEAETIPEGIDNIIAQYFDFFEPIYILLNKGIIHVKVIDDLFCFRFFSVVNNKYVQDKILTPHKDYYKNITRLHQLWKKYRLNNGLDIPLVSTDLSLVDWYNDFR